MSDGENNFAEFEAQMAAPAEAPADPVVEPAEVEAVDRPEDEVPEDEGEVNPAEPPQDGPKAKKTAQDRIDELTRARREAEREAKYFRDLYEGKAQPQRETAKDEGPKAPDPNDFDMGDMDPRYLDALVDFRVQQGLDKVQSRVAQDLHLQAGARVWEARQDEARAKFADYDEKVIDGAHNWPCTPEMAEAIRTSDAGGEVAYHLASNPDEARRIATLAPIAQARELGRIEATLTATPKDPPSVKTTNAPKPPQAQARGAGGQFMPNAATPNFAEFEAMANRKTG